MVCDDESSMFRKLLEPGVGDRKQDRSKPRAFPKLKVAWTNEASETSFPLVQVGAEDLVIRATAGCRRGQMLYTAH